MKRGFSLIEVMVSSTMLIAGLTGIISAISTTTSLHQHQRRITQGIAIGESVVEELLIRPISDTDLTSGNHPATPLQFDADGDRVVSGSGAYTVDWDVSSAPPAVPLMRTIKVNVRWTENGNSKTFSLSTIRR